MSKWKARLVTLLIVVLLILLGADAVAIWPKSLPYILGVFALPGVYLFAKYLYLWLTTESEPLKFPKWDGKKKRFVEGE